MSLPNSRLKSPDQALRIKEVARVFLKLGFTAFGGPAVHIAMMEEEIVRKRQWMDHAHFLDLLGATNLIPGPNSTEMALHCGRERAGLKGLLVAGACFILPAVFITCAFAWAYHSYGSLPQVRPYVYGIQPAIIGVIVALMIRLGKKAVKNWLLALIGVLAVVLALLEVNEVIVLFGCGILGMILYWAGQKRNTLAAVAPSAWALFWLFLKIGAILYGSGYVLFAFLDNELVKNGLLSRQVLTDAIAVGQFTPGPVFSSASFIGWQIAGWRGAIAGTVGIFLPSFLLVGLLNPLVFRLRKSKILSAFLDAVNVAAIALILNVCLVLTKTVVTGWQTACIAIIGFVVSYLLPKLNTAWIILGGALMGYVLSLI
jgi:chromate transporter